MPREILPEVQPEDDLESRTPEEEYEAWLAEQVVFEEYHHDKGVL